jgi:hypothetical protein
MILPTFNININDTSDTAINNRNEFIDFVQRNRRIFHELLYNRRYRLSDNNGIHSESIYASYNFFTNDLTDDANKYELITNTNDYLRKNLFLIRTFIKWLNNDLVQKYFKKEFNKQLREDIEKKREDIEKKHSQLEKEIEAKERVTERTFKIKDEFLRKDYIPDDTSNSVMGKSYREAKERFENLGKTFKRGGKMKNKNNKKKKKTTKRKYKIN